MNNVEKKRLYHSMAISTFVHLGILLIIACVSFAVYAASNVSEHQVLKVQYTPSEATVSRILEDPKSLSSYPGDAKVSVEKEQQKDEELKEVHKKEKAQFKKSNEKEEYQVVTNVKDSKVKISQIREQKDEQDVDVVNFNSEKFKKCTGKLHSFQEDQSLEKLEDIKNYYSELHLVLSVPRRADALVIDSYLNKEYHILYDITNDTTRERLKNYPKQAKYITIRNFSKVYESVKSMVKSERCDINNYEDVDILISRDHWNLIFSSCNSFLSKYNLTVDNDKVKSIVIQYIKKGSNYVIEVVYADIEKDIGRIVRIDN